MPPWPHIFQVTLQYVTDTLLTWLQSNIQMSKDALRSVRFSFVTENVVRFHVVKLFLLFKFSSFSKKF